MMQSTCVADSKYTQRLGSNRDRIDTRLCLYRMYTREPENVDAESTAAAARLSVLIIRRCTARLLCLVTLKTSIRFNRSEFPGDGGGVSTSAVVCARSMPGLISRSRAPLRVCPRRIRSRTYKSSASPPKS